MSSYHFISCCDTPCLNFGSEASNAALAGSFLIRGKKHEQKLKEKTRELFGAFCRDSTSSAEATPLGSFSCVLQVGHLPRLPSQPQFPTHIASFPLRASTRQRSQISQGTRNAFFACRNNSQTVKQSSQGCSGTLMQPTVVFHPSGRRGGRRQ